MYMMIEPVRKLGECYDGTPTLRGESGRVEHLFECIIVAFGPGAIGVKIVVQRE
jgi:hypothetical protein